MVMFLRRRLWYRISGFLGILQFIWHGCPLTASELKHTRDSAGTRQPNRVLQADMPLVFMRCHVSLIVSPPLFTSPKWQDIKAPWHSNDYIASHSMHEDNSRESSKFTGVKPPLHPIAILTAIEKTPSISFRLPTDQKHGVVSLPPYPQSNSYLLRLTEWYRTQSIHHVFDSHLVPPEFGPRRQVIKNEKMPCIMQIRKGNEETGPTPCTVLKIARGARRWCLASPATALKKENSCLRHQKYSWVFQWQPLRIALDSMIVLVVFFVLFCFSS